MWKLMPSGRTISSQKEFGGLPISCREIARQEIVVLEESEKAEVGYQTRDRIALRRRGCLCPLQPDPGRVIDRP